jgi:hypothetical protein
MPDRPPGGHPPPDPRGRDPDLGHPHDLRPVLATQALDRGLRLLERGPRPGGYPHPRELEHALGIPPALEARCDIGAHEEYELVPGSRVAHQLQSTKAERRPFSRRLDIRCLDPRIGRRRQPRQLQPHLGSRLRMNPLIGRFAHRDQHHLVQPELKRGLLGEHQVPDVRRVERAPEDADRADLGPPTL